MKLKPIAKVITGNNYMRFNPIYRCYCPQCGNLLKRTDNICKCGKEIDWSEFE